MNGFDALKTVIDTNVLFMALYNRYSKAGKIIESANQNKIKLFSTDTIKEELCRVLKRELNFSDEEIEKTIENLPVTWVKKEIYEKALGKTKGKHKADKPLEALSLILDCGILSADKHFKNRINIDKLLDLT